MSTRVPHFSATTPTLTRWSRGITARAGHGRVHLQLPRVLAAVLLGYACVWAALAIHVEPALGEEGRIEGRALRVERAALLAAATPQVSAPSPRARALPQPTLALIAFAVAVAPAAALDTITDAPCAEPINTWFRRARRLPRSDCSEPGAQRS